MNLKKNTIILVNLWGLGDLVPTLKLINEKKNNKYYLITPHNRKIVKELLDVFNIDVSVSVFSSKIRILLVIEIIKQTISGKLIIFTAPLANNSRKLASFLSFFSKNIILTSENGNIYKINREIKF